jgi:hypothetical protein
MNRFDSSACLEFKDEGIFHHHVQSITAIELSAFVMDGKLFLALI